MSGAPATAPDFAETLARMAAGERPAPHELAALSDLDRERARALDDAWPRVPDDVRAAVAVEAARLADARVDVEFTRFAAVALRDPLAEVRRAAVAALRESTARATARLLAPVLRDDPDDDAAAGAADLLGEFVLRLELGRFPEREGAPVLEALRAAAADPVRAPAVRAAALEALAPRSLPWIDALLLDACYGDDETVRLAAVRAMGRSAREDWLEYVLEQFASGDPAFRLEAAVAAGEIGSEDAVAPLADLFLDADGDVARAALAAVADIGGEVAVEHLREFAPDAPDELAELVGEAIDAAAGAWGTGP